VGRLPSERSFGKLTCRFYISWTTYGCYQPESTQSPVPSTKEGIISNVLNYLSFDQRSETDLSPLKENTVRKSECIHITTYLNTLLLSISQVSFHFMK
jgi:hypothetical protein